MMKCGNKDTNQASDQYLKKKLEQFSSREEKLYNPRKLMGSLITGSYKNTRLLRY